MAHNIATLTTLYTELNRFGQSGEYDKAVKFADKILRQVPDDDKAFHCKIVSLIQISQFDEALGLIKKNPNLSSDLVFEKAYCLYRVNQIKEALALLQEVNNPTFRIQELLAQVYYRLEKYEECFDTYRNIIKNSEDDYEDERETNLAAVIGSLSSEQGKDMKNAPQLREHTYELCYNNACILLGKKQYAEAITMLKKAEDLCRKTLEEEDTPEEEIDEELGIIRTQLGFSLQMQSKNDQALKLYNAVLKQRSSDVAVIAVASNNIVTINKEQNVFESKKRMKTATAEGLDSKLNSSQRCAIALNQCLFLYHINQAETCKKQIENVKKAFPSVSAQATLVQAALLCREKNVKEATDVLRSVSAANPDQTLNISFTLAQLLLSQGQVSQGCNVLKSLGDVSYKLGVISALITLYLSLEDKEAAAKLLKDSVLWYKKQQPTSASLAVLIRESAQFHLRHGEAKEAAALLEEQRKANPKDTKILAQLISAYSQLDPQKAKEVSKSLPPIDDLPSRVDVASLETASWTMGVKYFKKTGKAENSPSTPAGDLIERKKKKHRKGKLPKNYDPNVDPDPERWLPKRERSTFKKRKDRRGAVGKGTQGAIGGTTELDITKGTSLPSPRPGVTNPSPGSPKQGPRQTRPQPMPKKKKKKSGRW